MSVIKESKEWKSCLKPISIKSVCLSENPYARCLFKRFIHWNHAKTLTNRSKTRILRGFLRLEPCSKRITHWQIHHRHVSVLVKIPKVAHGITVSVAWCGPISRTYTLLLKAMIKMQLLLPTMQQYQLLIAMPRMAYIIRTNLLVWKAVWIHASKQWPDDLVIRFPKSRPKVGFFYSLFSYSSSANPGVKYFSFWCNANVSCT